MGSTVFPAAGGGVIPQSQTFTSSGTFTLPAGYGASKPLIVDIEICGGGGGGGGGAASTSSYTPYGGGGGGSGIVAVYTGIALTSNATITIGAGGNGGSAGTFASGNGGNGNNGTSGGTSNVNSLYYAPGGGFGTAGWYDQSSRNAFGGSVISNGYNLAGGWNQNNASSAGGAGGSGGTGGVTNASTDGHAYYGGSKGSSAIYRFLADNNGSTTFQKNAQVPKSGSGLGQHLLNQNSTGATNQVDYGVYGHITDILLLQRGAGGGGAYSNNNNVQGGGGAAGTKDSGGIAGYKDNLNATGSKNGGAASDAGCGGGGGGALMAPTGTAGAGGAGAAGYCIIRYWA